MIKLQDFAKQMGVTDRAIQKHLVKYADELDGLYQRKGPNGTWLTEEACDILRGKMKQQPLVLGDTQTQTELEDAKKRIEDLLEQKTMQAEKLAALYEWKAEKAQLIAEAEQTQLRLMAAEQEKVLLEGFIADAKAEISTLSNEKTKAEEKARLEAETAKKAQNKLTAAHERDRIREKREHLMTQYAAELAEWSSLGWFGKRKVKKPVPPELPELPELPEEVVELPQKEEQT